MSVSLNGSSQYLNANTAITSYPFTISAWFKTTNLTQDAVIANIGETSAGTGDDNNYATLRGGTAGDPVQARTLSSPSVDGAESTTGISSGTWHHVLAVFAADDDRRVYLDGGSKGTNSTSINADDTLAVYQIGCVGNGSGGFFEGNIAEVAFWSSALTDANAVTLAGGALPTSVDAGNLEEYWSLFEDANSDGGNSATNLTEQGSPSFDSGDHPDVGATSYVDIAGTTSGQASLSGVLYIATAAEIVGIASGQALLSGTLTIANFPAGSFDTSKTKQRLIAIANNSLYYEDV